MTPKERVMKILTLWGGRLSASRLSAIYRHEVPDSPRSESRMAVFELMEKGFVEWTDREIRTVRGCYDSPSRHDPRDELKDVMREIQRAMLGEAEGDRAGWTLRELADYCKRVRDAAIQRQLEEVGRPIVRIECEEERT